MMFFVYFWHRNRAAVRSRVAAQAREFCANFRKVAAVAVLGDVYDIRDLRDLILCLLLWNITAPFQKYFLTCEYTSSVTLRVYLLRDRPASSSWPTACPVTDCFVTDLPRGRPDSWPTASWTWECTSFLTDLLRELRLSVHSSLVTCLACSEMTSRLSWWIKLLDFHLTVERTAVHEQNFLFLI